MKQKYTAKIKLGFLLLFLMADFFGFGNLQQVFALTFTASTSNNYTIGQIMQVSMSMGGYDSSIQYNQVYINTYVNGTQVAGQNNSFMKTLQQITQGQASQNIPVTTANNFNVGSSNSVMVVLVDSASGTNYAQSTITNIVVNSSGQTSPSAPLTSSGQATTSVGQGAPFTSTTQATTSAPTPLYNPIPNAPSLTDLLIIIMKGFLGIVAVWAVAFIVIGGFRMVISQGNEEAVAVAKKTIVWAVLGLLVAVLSFAIIAIVQNLVGVQVQAPVAAQTPASSSNPITPPSNPIAPPSNVITAPQ